jgi:hypothetical protein
MSGDGFMWEDKSVDNLSREELIEALKLMIRREREYFTDSAMRARARINIDLLRHAT